MGKPKVDYCDKYGVIDQGRSIGLQRTKDTGESCSANKE